MGQSRNLFLYFRLFNSVDNKEMYIVNFADDWIRTAEVWYWKRLLYQLCHNHCPVKTFLIVRSCLENFYFGGDSCSSSSSTYFICSMCNGSNLSRCLSCYWKTCSRYSDHSCTPTSITRWKLGPLHFRITFWVERDSFFFSLQSSTVNSFFNGPTPASFRLFSVFSNKHYNF